MASGFLWKSKEVANDWRKKSCSPLLGIGSGDPLAIPKIVADKLAVTRVFRNIISNALKYGGKEHTKITIGFAETDRIYVLSFNNDGATIGMQDCETIFQIFRRLPASRQIEGSALGLAIVRDIVEA